MPPDSGLVPAEDQLHLAGHAGLLRHRRTHIRVSSPQARHRHLREGDDAGGGDHLIQVLRPEPKDLQRPFDRVAAGALLTEGHLHDAQQRQSFDLGRGDPRRSSQRGGLVQRRGGAGITDEALGLIPTITVTNG